jgi:transformation/transcription domain-associated protein
MEPCFNNKMVDAGKSLCTLIKIVFTAFPLDSSTTPQEVKILHQCVADLLQKNLVAVTAPQISLEAVNANPIISFALSVMKAVSEVQKNFIDHFIGLLLCALQRLVRDMGTSGLHSRQVGF